MIVWGGEGNENGSELFSDGAAFNPQTDEWRALGDAPLSPRRYHLATWTGQEMLIVGGVGLADGASYRPDTDTWRMISSPPIDVSGPFGAGIEGYVGAVWTGSEFVVWHVENDEAAAYDPENDQWRLLPPTGMKADNGVLRWNGEAVYGFGATVYDYPGTNELAVSRLVGDEWEPLPPTEFSTDTYIIGALPKLTVWAGNRFLAWSGSGNEGRTMAFDPALDSWSQTDNVPSPACDGQGEPIADQDRIFAFGWCSPDIAIYEIEAQTWTEVAVGGYPTARYTVWTGSQLINWGDTCCYGTGGRAFTVEAWRYHPRD